MKTTLSHFFCVLLMLLLTQSCGVIEKRRYSGGWSLNLNLGGGSEKGKLTKTPVKKKAPIQAKNEDVLMNWSQSADTTCCTEDQPNVYPPSMHGDEKAKSSQRLHTFTQKTVEFKYNDISFQNTVFEADSLVKSHHDPIKKNEPFAVIALFAILLGALGVFGLIFNTIIVFYTGIVLYEVFLALAAIGFPVGILSTLISHYKFRSKRIRDRFKNKKMYVASKTILLLLFLAGYVTLVILADSL